MIINERPDPNKGASQDGDPKQVKHSNPEIRAELDKLDAQEAKQAQTPAAPVDAESLQNLVQALLASSAIAMKREERLAKAEELELQRAANKKAQYEKNRSNETKIDLVKQSVCKHLKGGKNRRKSATKDYAVFMHTFISGETYIKCQLCGMKWRPTDTNERVVRNGMVYKNHTGKGWREALLMMEDSTNTPSRSEIPQSQWHLVESTVNLEAPNVQAIDIEPIGIAEV
jgi:hypothetical protein